MREFYVFGSLCRGEPDLGSDVDVLVICNQPRIRQHLPDSWSVYSPRRLKHLFDRGTLFAWHLYHEAVPIWPRGKNSFLKKIGPPKPYSEAKGEITDLGKILGSAVAELRRGTNSEVYELGVVALACRDIAMAATPALTGKFNFSRYAPLDLPHVKFPLNRSEFDYILNCRRASTRGAKFRHNRRIERHVRSKSERLCEWYKQMLKAVSDE